MIAHVKKLELMIKEQRRSNAKLKESVAEKSEECLK